MSTALEERMSLRQKGKLEETLFAAVATGTVAQVKEVLAKGASLNSADAAGDGPLIVAARDNPDPEVSKFLVEQGCDLMQTSEAGPTPVHYFASWGHVDLVRMALKRGAPVDGPPMRRRSDIHPSPLCYATRNDRLEVMDLLLKSGANPNHWNPTGRSAVHHAKSGAAIDLLCKHGAKLNPTGDFFPPLFVAARNPDGAPLCEAMIRNGANVNLRGAAGESALHIAHSNSCETLVRLGGDLEAADHYGLTPLAFAACFDDAAKCRELLRQGASLAPVGHVAPLAAASDDVALKSFTVLMEAGADPTALEPAKLERILRIEPTLRTLVDSNAERVRLAASAQAAKEAIPSTTRSLRPG